MICQMLLSLFRATLLLLAVLLVLSSSASAQVPVLSTGGVVNAADSTPDIARGAIISIYGVNLASATSVAVAVPLPVELSGAQVEVRDGDRVFNAPLFFVSAGQINAQMPFDLQSATVYVSVRTAAGESNREPVAVSAVAPRLFTTTMDGRGEAIALHTDFSVVSEESPALAGEWVILYLTGLGTVDPVAGAGEAGGNGADLGPLNSASADVSVTLEGQEANFYWAGLAPGFVGLYQVNFQIPEDVVPGRHAIRVNVPGSFSQSNVSIACDRTYRELAAVSVGAAGGTASAGGLSLEVPGGQMQDGGALLFSSAQGGTAYDEHRASPMYAVAGLPRSTDSTITVSLEIPAGTLISGESFVAVQDAGPGSAPLLAPARIEGGKAVAELPARSTGAATVSSAGKKRALGDNGEELLFYLLTGLKSDRDEFARFTLIHPESADASADFRRLDDSWIRVEQSQLGNPNIIPDVSLVKTRGPLAELWGEVRRSAWSGGYTILMNAEWFAVAKPEDLQPKTNHLVCHYVQMVPHPRFNTSSEAAAAFPLYQPHWWLWYYEAMATHFERGSTSDLVVSSGTSANVDFAVRRGLQFTPAFVAGNRDAIMNHGYGAAMFLEVVDPYKNELSKLAGVLAGRVHPAMAPATVMTYDGWFPEKWEEFCESYTTGDVFHGSWFPQPQVVLGWARPAGILDPAGIAGVREKTLYWQAPDLSARYYLVRLAEEWPSGSRLEVSVQSPNDAARVKLYSVRGTDISEIPGRASLSAPISVNNPSEIVANGGSLLVLVANGNAVNPFIDPTAVTVRLSVKEDAQPSDLLSYLENAKCFSIHLDDVAFCKESDQDWYACGDPVVTNCVNGTPAANAIWSGDSFSLSGTWIDLTSFGNDPQYSIDVRATVERKTGDLVNGEVEWRKVENNAEGDPVTSSYSFNFGRIPYTYPIPPRENPGLLGYNWKLMGPIVSSTVSDLTYRVEKENKDGTTEPMNEAVKFEWGDAKLSATFLK